MCCICLLVGSPKNLSAHDRWLHLKSSWVHTQVTKNCFVIICLQGTKRGFTIGHTYTHTGLINGPFSWTNQVSRYQKGKTNLDFTEARDSEWQRHQLGHIQVCISPDR